MNISNDGSGKIHDAAEGMKDDKIGKLVWKVGTFLYITQKMGFLESV